MSRHAYRMMFFMFLAGAHAGCNSGTADVPAGASMAEPGPAVTADPSRPAPGADLTGPVPVPAASRAPVQRDVKPLDLGTDRVARAIDIPEPPRGGAVQFTFADDRPGWVAQVPDTQQLPAAAYGDDKIYVSGGFGSVSFYAMDARTGRFDWATTNLEDNGPTAAVYDDGRVIFNTESCTLFALDAATGKRLWHRWLGDPTLAQTAVSDGLIYAAHPDSDGDGYRLSAFNVKNGARAWSRSISGELLATPVVHGDSVYVATLSGWTYRFERTRGERRWAKKLHATTAPWLAGDELYVSVRDGKEEKQAVISAATGDPLREYSVAFAGYVRDVPKNLDDWQAVWQFEGSRPVVDRGVRYVAMGGEVHATDAATGAPLWIRRYAPGAGKRSVGTVALAGPQAVVATRDGQLFGLDIDTGYTVWAYDLGQPILAQPIIAGGWVYVTGKKGQVIGLQVGDPTLDGWHMFGGNPQHNGPVSRPKAPDKTAEQS